MSDDQIAAIQMMVMTGADTHWPELMDNLEVSAAWEHGSPLITSSCLTRRFFVSHKDKVIMAGIQVGNQKWEWEELL